jgi:hypothetical protein
MKNYRKLYEQYHGIKIPKGFHIHHIDGNHDNNNIENLKMLSADDHAKKHGFLNNFIMAQSTACERAIHSLRKPEIREKMSASVKNSKKHKEFIDKRSKNSEWYINVSEACRKTAKNRVNPPWNKGKTGLQITSEETKKLLSQQRTGRKWFNDGEKSYFIHPEIAKSEYKLGRK